MVHELEEELRQPARQLNQDELWAAVLAKWEELRRRPGYLPEPGGLDEAAAGAVLRGSGRPHLLLNRSVCLSSYVKKQCFVYKFYLCYLHVISVQDVY